MLYVILILNSILLLVSFLYLFGKLSLRRWKIVPTDEEKEKPYFRFQSACIFFFFFSFTVKNIFYLLVKEFEIKGLLKIEQPFSIIISLVTIISAIALISSKVKNFGE